jgi:hypothetical protein
VVTWMHKQREQFRLHGQFLSMRLCAVRALSCRTSQAKNLHFGSLEAFHKCLMEGWLWFSGTDTHTSKPLNIAHYLSISRKLHLSAMRIVLLRGP